MTRRLLPLLAVGAILLVPSTSWSHPERSTSSLSGTITTITGGIKVAVTNTGTDQFNYIWIRMVPSVHHTGASIDHGGGCGPGPDLNTVKCGISYAGFQPNTTYVVTIMTDGPYPPNGGAQLFTGAGTNGPLVAAGVATGPPPTTTPPPPTIKVKCKCASLTARILPGTVKVRDEFPRPDFVPRSWAELTFQIHWSLTCTRGTTGCDATLTAHAPKGRTYTTSFSNGNGLTKEIEVECEGSCGKPIEGSAAVRIVAGQFEAHDRRAVGSIPFVLERDCVGAKNLAPIRLSIAFNANGNVDLKRSKLH